VMGGTVLASAADVARPVFWQVSQDQPAVQEE